MGLNDGLEKRSSVLVVEDDRSNRYALTRLLESFGLRVTMAGSSREARELVTPAHQFILLDWMLQEGDASALLREMRAAAPASRIGIITVAHDRAHEISSHRPDALFTKPLDLPRLRHWFVEGGAALAPESV